MTPFAFLGRCSTEDQQDPESSRNWQLTRAKALVEPRGGIIVAEYFDIGMSRSLPWQRRPRAKDLLDDLADPGRGFDAVVIGEPHRAFYGNQFGLTFPLFTHYGVELWVPEVGGPLDPDNEAHDLVMSVFGGMSKGERNRIKVRVRTAMAAQTQVEGRYLGGRPPYGYQIVDAGPHPNPAKAADGRRLHRLDLDPTAAPVVERIFNAYLAGRGFYAIAEELTSENIPCPSAHDRARNPHRSGVAWSKMAVRAILANPRYTGHQVWNRQHKDEVLLDVKDVAMGHRTKLTWNHADKWVWSDELAHPALIDVERWQQVQEKLASKGATTVAVKPRRSSRPYALRGLLFCGLCDRRMQGHWLRDLAYYRCRFPNEYAMANQVSHPRNVYLRENQILGHLDDWLLTALTPGHLQDTVEAMYASQPDEPETDPEQQVIREADRKITQYRALLDAGTDPALVARWIAETTVQRAAAKARQRGRQRPARLNRAQIQELVSSAGDLRTAIRRADATPAKTALYKSLGLRLTYQPAQQNVRAEANLKPDIVGIKSVSEGGLGPPRVADVHRSGAHATQSTSCPAGGKPHTALDGDSPADALTRKPEHRSRRSGRCPTTQSTGRSNRHAAGKASPVGRHRPRSVRDHLDADPHASARPHVDPGRSGIGRNSYAEASPPCRPPERPTLAWTPAPTAAAGIAGIQGSVLILMATGDITHLESALDLFLAYLNTSNAAITYR